MDYSFEELEIHNLVELIEKDKVDLAPSYQRNFIWSLDDQKALVDTILKGYPLPNFFMYKKSNGFFEMVDGQQRSRTIFRFVKGLISSSKDSGNLVYSNCDSKKILGYRLPFIIITNLSPTDSLNEFYVLINKKGKHLNTPELYKSEFHDKNLFKLSEEMLSYQNLINLNLFTAATSKRMNDRAFIEELIAYLHMGIKEKKSSVESIYQERDITQKEYSELKERFCSIIDVIERFNNLYPISKTRYRQKNDFYTLFNFIDKNLDLKIDTMEYMYRVLLVLNGKDSEGNQFIRPSNEDCEPFREYATHCVSQSNSKRARKNRLNFFDKILKNNGNESNDTFDEVINYLAEELGEEKIQLVKKDKFTLLDVNAVN